MDPVLRVLLTNAAAAGAVAIAAWSASRLVRRPTVVHALWLVAVLRLLAPPLLSLPILPGAAADLTPARGADARGHESQDARDAGSSQAGRAEEPPPRMEPRAAVQRPATAHLADTASPLRVHVAPVDARTPSSRTLPTVVSTASRVTSGERPWTAARVPIDARMIGWAAWPVILLGAMAVMVLSAWRHARFARLLRCAEPAPAPLVERATVLAGRLGLRRAPPVRVVAARLSPLLWPTSGGPQLLLPRDLVGQLTDEERDALLVHELAHVRRRDHWVRLLEISATALFWWYPLAWWIRRALRRAEERCCDEWVLRTLPGSAHAYASGLLKSATLVCDDSTPLPAGASGAGPVRELESRLKEILMARPSPQAAAPIRLALATLAVAGLTVFPTRAAPTSPEETPPASTAGTTAPAAATPPALPTSPARAAGGGQHAPVAAATPATTPAAAIPTAAAEPSLPPASPAPPAIAAAPPALVAGVPGDVAGRPVGGVPPGTAPPQAPAFPAGVDIVRVDAVVLDRDGRPVKGLTAADFEVLENGKRREVASFEAIDVREQAASAPAAPETESAPRVLLPQEGRAVLVYFDDIHVQAENAVLVRRQLAPFLSRELHPGDAITIVAPQQGLWWTARTAWEQAQLPSVVKRLRGQYVPDPFGDHLSDWAVMQHIEYGDVIVPSSSGVDPSRGVHIPGSGLNVREQELYGLALLRIQRSLNGLQRAVESLAGFRGRKSVVIYSEGFILSPALQDYDRVIDLCRRANVALYVMDPRGLRTGSVASAAGATALGTETLLPGTRYEAESAGSTHIALATGGAAYQSNDTTEALARVLEESTAYYLIGFQPAAGPAGERKLQVRVGGKDLRVRARNRYFAGSTKDTLGDAAAVRAARELSDRAEVPIRVATVPGDVTGAVELHLSLEPMQPARERTLKLLIEARPLAGGDPVHDAANLTVLPAPVAQDVLRELRLAPGVWQARVVVTDTSTGAIGSALHTFSARFDAR